MAGISPFSQYHPVLLPEFSALSEDATDTRVNRFVSISLPMQIVGVGSAIATIVTACVTLTPLFLLILIPCFALISAGVALPYFATEPVEDNPSGDPLSPTISEGNIPLPSPAVPVARVVSLSSSQNPANSQVLRPLPIRNGAFGPGHPLEDQGRNLCFINAMMQAFVHLPEYNALIKGGPDYIIEKLQTIQTQVEEALTICSEEHPRFTGSMMSSILQKIRKAFNIEDLQNFLAELPNSDLPQRLQHLIRDTLIDNIDLHRGSGNIDFARLLKSIFSALAIKFAQCKVAVDEKVAKLESLKDLRQQICAYEYAQEQGEEELAPIDTGIHRVTLLHQTIRIRNVGRVQGDPTMVLNALLYPLLSEYVDEAPDVFFGPQLMTFQQFGPNSSFFRDVRPYFTINLDRNELVDNGEKPLAGDWLTAKLEKILMEHETVNGVDKTAQSFFVSPPDSLAFELVRYEYVHGRGVVKITDSFPIPMAFQLDGSKIKTVPLQDLPSLPLRGEEATQKKGELDMTESSADLSFVLDFFTVHQDSSGSYADDHGHHVCYLKKGEKWFYCSDNIVREVTPAEIATLVGKAQYFHYSNQTPSRSSSAVSSPSSEGGSASSTG